MTISTRLMEDKDLDRVTYMEECSFSMPWKREDFKRLIDDEGSTYLVIEADGEVVGAAGYTDQVGVGYINNVVIDERFRGRKLSYKLMKALLDDGISRGLTDFTLEVRVSNLPAVRLYEGLGFKSAGVRKNFYERPVEDAYVMWLYTSQRGQ